MTAQLPIEPLPVKKPALRYAKWGAGLLIGALQRDVGWLCHGGNACMGWGAYPQGCQHPQGQHPPAGHGGPGEPYRRMTHWRAGGLDAAGAGCGAARRGTTFQ